MVRMRAWNEIAGRGWRDGDLVADHSAQDADGAQKLLTQKCLVSDCRSSSILCRIGLRERHVRLVQWVQRRSGGLFRTCGSKAQREGV